MLTNEIREKIIHSAKEKFSSLSDNYNPECSMQGDDAIFRKLRMIKDVKDTDYVDRNGFVDRDGVIHILHPYIKPILNEFYFHEYIID